MAKAWRPMQVHLHEGSTFACLCHWFVLSGLFQDSPKGSATFKHENFCNQAVVFCHVLCLGPTAQKHKINKCVWQLQAIVFLIHVAGDIVGSLAT
eukprot:2696863-Amphidinium_carterae.2